jgi:hypothetical protein
VAEDSLHVGDVGAALEEVGGAGMPQRVRVKPGDAGGGAVVLDEPAEHRDADATAEPVQEESALFGIVEKEWTSVVEVPVDGVKGLLGNGNDTVLPAFAGANEERLFLKVEVIDVEGAALAHADSGAIEELEDGAVANAERRLQRRKLENALHLLPSGNEPRKPTSSGQPEMLRGILEEHAPAVEKGEEALHGGDVRALGAERERRSRRRLSFLESESEGDEVVDLDLPHVLNAHLT